MTVLFMKLLLNNVMLTIEVRKELPTDWISSQTAFAGNGGCVAYQRLVKLAMTGPG
jgi:hypothetical protein